MHGTLMLLMFATPLFFAFGNLIMPIQIGSPDVAFPRLNAFSFWLFLFGSTDRGRRASSPRAAPADFGWTAYTPLSTGAHSPGVGGSLWIGGLAVSGLGTILGGVNFITTIVCLRAPGMTMFRMPIFVWNTLVTSLLDPAGLPDPHRRAVRAAGRPQPRRPRLLRRDGRPDAVAAPVLVLRASRGLHHRAAVLRHHHRDHPGVQPQAAVRLQGHGRRDDGHRLPVAGRVGAPHVRDRRGAAAVLRVPDLPDRRADRAEVLQLDRHHVAGPADLRDADAVVDRLHGHLPARRPDRCPAGQPAAGLARQRHATSSSPTSTTSSSAPWSSRPTPASPSGSRRCAAGCWTSGWASCSSG